MESKGGTRPPPFPQQAERVKWKNPADGPESSTGLEIYIQSSQQCCWAQSCSCEYTSFETTFPGLFNCSVCCVGTAVAVCLYNCQEPIVQLYRQGKGVSIYDDGGCTFRSLRIYCLVLTSLQVGAADRSSFLSPIPRRPSSTRYWQTIYSSEGCVLCKPTWDFWTFHRR